MTFDEEFDAIKARHELAIKEAQPVVKFIAHKDRAWLIKELENACHDIDELREIQLEILNT